jgi:hypothetical protein
MTPDWSRPVFSSKASFEPPPPDTGPRIPTSRMAPGWDRAPQPFAPQPSADLPPAWRRAVEQSVPPAPAPAWPSAIEPAPAAPTPPAAFDAAPGDHPVIQPSSAPLSRYRPPLPDVTPERQSDEPPAEPPAQPPTEQDLGGGL